MNVMLRQQGRLATVATVLGPDAVVLERMTATERLGEPFTFVLDVVSHKVVDFLPILGTGVAVAVSERAGVARHFQGVLFEAADLGDTDSGTRYRLVLRPWLALLAGGLNSRLWQKKSVKQIVEDVFKAAGFSGYKTDKLTKGLSPREYCVQYRESDFNFVSRLLEEEGIYYYFEHTADSHILVLCDQPSHHAPAEGLSTIKYYPVGEASREELHFWDWSEQVRPGAQKVSLRDSHFKVSTEARKASAEASAQGDNDKVEIYDYPGGYAYLTDEGTTDGAAYAKARLQAARAERRKFQGAGSAFGISAGSRFTLANHETDRFNAEYLVVGATHTLTGQSFVSGGSGGATFEVQVEVIPHATPWTPPLRTPKPVAGGPQTALVVGPEGETIHVDEHGRIRVQFYWDRRDKKPDGSPIKPDDRSCWVRVSQGWADAGFGSMLLPRIGEEVIVDFLDGDLDVPIVTGRVYNAQRKYPYALPGEKTKSTWKSQTVGDAGSYPQTEEPPPSNQKGYNEIGFEDKGGKEEIFVHAQRDMKTWIRHDQSLKVGHNVAVRVGYNRETTVKNDETFTLEDGSETHTLKKGSRETLLEMGNDHLTLKMGNLKRSVEMGNWVNQVKMGNYSLKADLGKVTIEAMQEIELKVGGSSIKIDQMGVTVKGAMMAKVEGGMMLELKGGVMGKLEAGAMLTVKGGLVMIN
jgi:type VI secretion system secreted protein VgrG